MFVHTYSVKLVRGVLIKLRVFITNSNGKSDQFLDLKMIF